MNKLHAKSAALQEACGIFSETNMFKMNTPLINKKGKQLFKSPPVNKLFSFITQCPEKCLHTKILEKYRRNICKTGIGN